MTERWIQYALARYSASPVCMWQQLYLIPNCQTSPVWWEADLLAVSRAGYCTEVEIKCTLSDWKADQKKGKHAAGDEPLIKRFYYAGPMALMKRFDEVWTRPGSGIIGVERDEYHSPRIRILREAEPQKARKLTERELVAFGRTCNIRYWNWAADQHESWLQPALEPEHSEASP